MDNLIDFIFPKTCYVCSKEGKYLCVDCFKRKIKVDPINRCHICEKESRVGLIHRECSEYTYLDGVINITLYDDLIKKMIYDIKYNYYYSILNFFAEVMSHYLNFYTFNSSNSIITFVPSSKSKLRLRGFNQSKMLASKVSLNSQIQFRELLIKNKNTSAQAKLQKAGRAENLSNAFELVKSLKSQEGQNLEGKDQIVVIDDIFTTGATLNECAKVIKSRLEAKVFGFVIAKARS